jgi:hypothetical protein
MSSLSGTELTKGKPLAFDVWAHGSEGEFAACGNPVLLASYRQTQLEKAGQLERHGESRGTYSISKSSVSLLLRLVVQPRQF